MVKRKNEFESEIRENMRDGKGKVEIIRLLPDSHANEKCRLFARIMIPKGASIGPHTHSGEIETYYILSGEAEAFDDQGGSFILKEGDAMYTGFGAGHSIQCISEEDLEFIALILLD